MSSSWVIVDRETGSAICEVYGRKALDSVDKAKYETVPILEWLHRLNAQADHVGEGEK